MQYRLVACDIDGTLLRPDYSLGAPTKEALIDCLNRGLTVSLVTGRRPRSALRVAREIDPRVRVIANDGAVCLRQNPVEVTHQVTIPKNRALSLIRSGLDRELATFAYRSTFDGPDVHCVDDFDLPQARRYMNLTPRREISCIDDLTQLQWEPSKIAFMGTQTMLSEVHQQHQLGDSAMITWDGYLDTHWLTVISEGVDKSHGLARLAAELSIGLGQVIAFGDNHNDIPMFRWAHTAVAMENAVAALKQVATAVAPGNSEDGVARYLRENVLAADS